MDYLSGAIGAVSTAALGILAWYSKFYWLRHRARKEAASQDQETGEFFQDLRHKDQSFIAEQYRRLLRDHGRDLEKLKDELVALRAATSKETHDLRDRLGEALLEAAVLRERLKNYEGER